MASSAGFRAFRGESVSGRCAMMKYRDMKVAGAYVVEPETFPDERGLFARSFCSREFSLKGLNGHIAQTNFSFSHRKGTLRGLHYQAPPHEEAKLVRCTAGACFDVVVDLRKDSPTYLKWDGIELTAANRLMVYMPEGCAHGLITTADNTEMHYFMSALYEPNAARGMRWDDPAVGIKWPIQPVMMTEKDCSWPLIVPNAR